MSTTEKKKEPLETKESKKSKCNGENVNLDVTQREGMVRCD